MSWAGAAGKRNAGCHCLIGRRLGGYLLADTYHKLHFLHLHSIRCSQLSARERWAGWSNQHPHPSPAPHPSQPLKSSLPVPSEPLIYLLGMTGSCQLSQDAMTLPVDALHHQSSSNQALGSRHHASPGVLLRSLELYSGPLVTDAGHVPSARHSRATHQRNCSILGHSTHCSQVLHPSQEHHEGILMHPCPTCRHMPRATLPSILWPRSLPHLRKVAECNYAESSSGAISIRQTSVVSFSLSKAFLLPNCSYRIIA